MTALEEQLTRASRRLSAQYETEQRRQSGQVEALRGASSGWARRTKSCRRESSGSTRWRHAWPSIPRHPPSRDRAASVSDASPGTESRSGSEPL